MTTYTQDLARIASDIDRHGIAANETAVTMMVERARTADVNPVLLSVLSDATQPEVARVRAFGKIATALAAARSATSDPQPREHGQHPAMVVA
jgi:hypothetical protein